MTQLFCNKTGCLHYKPLPEGEKHHLGEEKPDQNVFLKDAYCGTCDRDTVFLRGKRIEGASGILYNITECASYSDSKISGHLDFSRFCGSDEGHNIIG